MSKLRPLHVLAALCAWIFIAASMPANVVASVPVRQPHTQSSVSTTLAAAPNSKLTREVFGFALGNASLADSARGYPSWQFDLLSTVVYFGLSIQWDGTIVRTDSGWATWNSSALTRLVATAHAHGTRVLLSVNLQDFSGSPTSSMCAALHPVHRKVTVAQTAAQVRRMAVDGVNIDYEGLNETCAYGQTTRAEMTALATEMRAALPSAYVAVDTYAGAAADPFNFFDVAALAPSVDTFFVMAYDMEYSNQHRAPLSCSDIQYLDCLGPTAPLTSYYYNDTSVMSQYVSVAGANKVILGVPYYGRKACVGSAVANALPTSNVVADDYLSASGESTDPSVLPGSYVSHRDRYDGAERWDTWYNTSLRCTRELYWDDASSLGRKYDLAVRQGVRGVGIFALQYGGGAPELWNQLASHFTQWTATYSMSEAFGGWQPGQARAFNVRVTNTSGVTWPAGGANFTALDVHFTTVPGGPEQSGHWLTSEVYPIQADVLPGQTVAIPVIVTAPQASGSMWLEVEMYRNHLMWSPSYQSVPVRVAQVLWSGTYDLAAAPTTWKPTETRTFAISVKNSGNATWPSGGANPVRLDVNFASTPGGSAAMSTWVSSVVFPLPADVAPGQTATVAVKVTSPASPGTYYLEAQLFRDHRFWFDSWQPVLAAVAPAWSATYDITAVPLSWSPGQGQSFVVSVTNTGSQPWLATGDNYVALDLHFATRTGGAAASASWLTSEVVRLPATVAPGQTAHVTVHVTAPRQAGAMYLEAELFKYHQMWFDAFQPVAVAVGSAQWSAGYELTGVPTAWAAGQTRAFSVSLRNTGTTTWPASGANPVALDMHFTTVAGGAGAQGSWLTSEVFSLPTSVVPGQTVQVPVTVTAPARVGALYLEAGLFKDHRFWFPTAQPVAVSFRPALWWSTADLAAAPLAWTRGQTQSFTVVLTNTGRELWPSTGPHPVEVDVHFSTQKGGAAVESSWAKSQVFPLSGDVAAGGAARIGVTVTAPTRPGLYYLEVQVFKNHELWMESWQPVAVTVA